MSVTSTRVVLSGCLCCIPQDVGIHLQEVGREFGVTTGRRRRCGWLDLVVLKYSCLINGYDTFNLTKLDVLDDFKEIKVAVKYLIDGKELSGFPGGYIVSNQAVITTDCVLQRTLEYLTVLKLST